MATFLAFLRAVNVGGKRMFPKADLRDATEGAGFTDVLTHLNSGNVRVSSAAHTTREGVESALEAVYRANRGFEVPTIAFEAGAFVDLVREAQALSAVRPGLARHYVYLLKDELDEATAAEVEATSSDVGEMIVTGRAVHALLGPGYQQGKLDPLRATARLGIATNRNLSVISALAERWC